MKPPAFDYVRPHSLAEALQLLARHGEDAKPIAGGQSLVPLLSMRLAQPAVLVDVGGLPELGALEAGPEGCRIGAAVTEATLERLPAGRLPAMAAAALPHIGHFQIRNRGTVGGSLCHLDPAAEWPALALALGATLMVASAAGSRSLSAAGFMRAPLTTVLEPDELLVEIRLPPAPDAWGFAEVERRPGDFALVGAACARTGGDWTLVVFATGSLPHRLRRTEALVRDGLRPGAELVASAAAEIDAQGDIHAPAAYRRQVGAALVGRVVEQACA